MSRTLMEQIDKEQIKQVISHSQLIKDPVIDPLLDDWQIAKNRIANKFLHGKVSYTWPEKVRFELKEEAKEEKLGHLSEFISNILDDWNHPLVKFLDQLSANEFYNNTLNTDYIITARDNKKILKGSKIIKAFKYFIDDPLLLHDLQDKASELIQENKVEGYLTFSIHPLDFLSSSENTHNWRSCHSLDGEHRSGNLSYMCDSGTMIVFLAPEKQEVLPNFPETVPWNSKKWRVLLHFDKELDVCFASRQYPFSAEGALDTVYEVFQEILAPFREYWGSFKGNERQQWSGWRNDYMETFMRNNGQNEDIEELRYFIANHGVYDRYAVMKDVPGSLHFNDVLRSSCYEKPYYMYKEYYGPTNIEFEVGSLVKCLHCGTEHITGLDTMMCIDCECEYGHSDSDEYRVCDCCGARFYYSNGYWVGDDDMVCPHCAETKTFLCEDCGERCYNDQQHWSEELKGYICNYCYDSRSGK